VDSSLVQMSAASDTTHHPGYDKCKCLLLVAIKYKMIVLLGRQRTTMQPLFSSMAIETVTGSQWLALALNGQVPIPYLVENTT
jgi:hypothetical protein